MEKRGGVPGIAKGINSSSKGLSSSDIPKQIELYGTNELPEAESISFLGFVWEALKDRTLIVLMFAAAIEVGIGIYKIVEYQDVFSIFDLGISFS